VLELDGNTHDLQVGYITEAPVWRPSYRLVIEGNGQASMQAWGIIQNLSGEDWKGVRLSLVAGAPLAFEATLGTPVIPRRPTVTDQGEVIAAVPRSETSLAQDEPKSEAAAPAVVGAMAEVDESEASDAAPSFKGSMGGRVAPSKKAARPSGSGAASRSADKAVAAPPQAPAPVMSVMPVGPRSLQSLAAVTATGGVTRYDLPEPVNVPDKSATMVMLLSKRVSGDAAFLFAPDGGVPDSSSHPFRVARFSNQTGGALEKGPIAVFDRGSFLGQGMVDPLPNGATATVPFALERAIAIDRTNKTDELGERVQKIDNGQLFVERDSVVQSMYRIRNGGEAAAKVLVKHARIPGSRLEKAPAGTEDNVGNALVPFSVGAKSEGTLVVDERTSVHRQEAWTTPVADAAVRALLANGAVDAAIKSALAEAWKFRNEAVQLGEVQAERQREMAELASQSEETRRSLQAIEKNRVADALRLQLTKRLESLSRKSEEIGKQLVGAQAKLTEVNVRFRDLLRTIKYVAPAK
jgi:hypothetical protein